jgi:glycosyltransferase involved in cell wall biosynthesis
VEGVELWIAGRRRADFPVIAEEPGLRILGTVNEADLPRLYSGSTAVIYPSLYEGFGLPVLEAMQCGAVVITSKDPAIGEVAGDAAVRVVDDGLAEAMRAAASGAFEHLRDRAVERARLFSWRLTAERTRAVYEEAVRRGQPRSSGRGVR